MDDIPRSTDVHDTVDNNRRCLESAIGAEIEIPGQAQLFDVVIVYQ